MTSAHKSAKDEASKYGIYEVESDLNANRKKDHLDFKDEFQDKVAALGLSENTQKNAKVFAKENHQTANAFSAANQKQGADLSMTSRRKLKRQFVRAIDSTADVSGTCCQAITESRQCLDLSGKCLDAS